MLKILVEIAFFYAAVLSVLFTNLVLVKGTHSNQYSTDTAHFWVKDDNEKIYDPTAAQYDPGEYVEETHVSAMKNLDFIVNNPLFESLNDFDKKYIMKLVK